VVISLSPLSLSLSNKISFGVKGEILELKNTMVGPTQLVFSTRVALEVGTKRKLGGQHVKDVGKLSHTT
jgi:hypothetical protein